VERFSVPEPMLRTRFFGDIEPFAPLSSFDEMNGRA
jgi:hypothetical protein